MTDRPLLARHTEALNLFAQRVHSVADDEWDAPTPCTDWTVRDLVGHLVNEQLWVPPLVRDGATMAEVGDRFDGDVLGDGPVAAWDAAARGARAAFKEPGALDRDVDLSYGKSSAVHYCGQMITDLVVHAWDLSRAIGADEQLPSGLVDFAAKEVAPYVDGLAGSSLFARPVTPPADAGSQTRLLCLLGREP